MAKERLKSPRARLFIALALPGEVRDQIVAWGERALRDAALRRVPRESLHITLAFLGYLDEKEIPRLAGILEAGSAPAPQIRLGDPVPRPERGRPRLFALPAESPAAVSLQADLEGMLAEARLYTPEKRPFWPHVTVARVRREEPGSRRPARIARAPEPLPKELLQPVRCVRLCLYRSELKPQGAQYTQLEQVELPKNGRQ